MHRRDGTALGLVLAILNKTDGATDIFKKLANVCGLSGITVEAPYKKGIPGQCHRCQLYGHAATNCHAPPRCVKCLDPHWTKECSRTRDSEGKPACCNCGSDHTANYGGCPAAPKPNRKVAIIKIVQKSIRHHVRWTYPTSRTKQRKQTDSTDSADETYRKQNFHPAPKENQWKNPLPWVNQKPPEPKTGSHKTTHTTDRNRGFRTREDIGTIMSILQVVRSAEVADLAAKFRKAKHGVDRLKIILENQELISKLENI
ncbi:Nucleic-acid-binding protein from transposon X-element [Eumeta japonica]|uniref:Nucleic-acid-binding protein from transposon X-element n=1 Tax=Eumeta variegata TaxID=151549 RepID=A0A4C1ZKU6_EUMVA|nr:Nucleic-acid-binding protein from transposon X-element [Eumeta japonica]